MTIINYADQTLQQAYLRAAYTAIVEEETALQRNREFYEGDQGIALTARQKEYLGDLAGDIDEQALANICRRAVEIPLERLSVTAINSDGTGDSSFADMVNVWWKSNQLKSWQYDTYEYALRDGVSCLIVGWDGYKPTYTLNSLYDGSEGQVRLHYSGDDGSLMFASKRYMAWDPKKIAPTGKTRLTLYFPDRIERYEASSMTANGWRDLTPEEAGAPNPQPWVDWQGKPLGIAVVPFWNPGGSELDDVLMPQKAMNKSLADLLSASDMHGFPLLALKGYSAMPGPDGKIVPLKIAPGEALTVPPAGDVTRVPGADLKPMFETGALAWLQICSIIKGWPLYLWARGDPPSGESLKVMETSLVKQVNRKQEGFTDSWMEAFTLGAKLHRLYTGQELRGGLDIKWAPAETRNEKAEMETLAMKWDKAEIPTVQRWREAGYSDEDIARMQGELTSAAIDAARQTVMAALMAQRTFSPSEDANQLTSGQGPEGMPGVPTLG